MIAERTKALLNAAAVIYAGVGQRHWSYEECVVATYALLARIEAREKAQYGTRDREDGCPCDTGIGLRCRHHSTPKEDR